MCYHCCIPRSQGCNMTKYHRTHRPILLYPPFTPVHRSHRPPAAPGYGGTGRPVRPVDRWFTVTVACLILLVSRFHSHPNLISILVLLWSCTPKASFQQNQNTVPSIVFHGLRRTSLTDHRSPYTPPQFLSS